MRRVRDGGTATDHGGTELDGGPEEVTPRRELKRLVAHELAARLFLDRKPAHYSPVVGQWRGIRSGQGGSPLRRWGKVAVVVLNEDGEDPLKVLWVQAQQPVESGRGRAGDGSGGRPELACRA